MNIGMAGLPVVGLLIAPEGDCAYCVIKDRLSPDLFYKAIGTNNFGVCTRYLGPMPFLVVFDKEAPDEALTPLHDPEFNRSVIGNVLIFGKGDDGSFRSLTDFELTALRNNTVLLSKRGITYFGINNVTRSPGKLNVSIDNSSDRAPEPNGVVSLMTDQTD